MIVDDMDIKLSLITLVVAANTSSLLYAADDVIFVTGSNTSGYFAESDSSHLSSGSASRLGLTDKQTPRHTETISARTITAMGND
ncbi:MAG: hypothetical protein XXXJIFNMEKO3_03184 [Candidatus Erwinia impunctatus]|nr:hypothetical protein XXXJIFNMEKO_03184 [Culicoides impunctatus]